MANPIIISEPKKTINTFESLWNASALPIQYIISNDKYPVGAAVTNYYSEITISVNGSDVATIEQLPDSNNETKVDIRKFIQSVLKFIPSTFPGAGRDTNAFCEFSISGFEKYLDNLGNPQSNPIDNGGNIFYSSLSSLQFGSETGGNMYDYVLDSSKTDLAKWMTLFERGSIIDINNYTLSIIVNDPDFDLSIDQFDKNGGLLTNDIINVPDEGIGVYRFNTNQIEFEEDTAYITIEGQKSSVAVTELFPIDVDVKCAVKIPAPSNLVLSNETTSSIQLDWMSNSAGEESGFGIERSLDGISFSQIDTVGSGVTTYVDSGLTEGTTYYYRVRALGASPSGYSNIVMSATLSIFEDVAEMFSVLQLVKISDNIEGNKTYNIRRSSDNAQTTVLWEDKIGQAITLDSPVLAGGTLGDWVGANDAFVENWYKQSKLYSGSDGFVGVLSPRLINSGVLSIKDGIQAHEYGFLGTQSRSGGTENINGLFPLEDIMAITVGHCDGTSGSDLAGAATEWLGNTQYINRGVSGDTTLAFNAGGANTLDDVGVRNDANTRINSFVYDRGLGQGSIWLNGTAGEQNKAISINSNNVMEQGVNFASAASVFLKGSVRFHGAFRESDVVNRAAFEARLAQYFNITYPS